ncbi:MAG: GIY-YIG nuclease family protein, partial [Bacteroidetes bacterium]|nr:GIY-YIG nuclease family protein [Bacteroidota bacterium]
MHYVYILKCADSTYYTGCTGKLDERIDKHNLGYVAST